MHKIIDKKQLTQNTFELKVQAPLISRKTEPGQFLIIRLDEKGERIPLTIADWDNETVTLVITVVGETTEAMSRLEIGDSILDISGPLGNPVAIKNHGTVVLIGGGCGTAATFPEARAFKEAGCRVISIIGARSKDSLIWQDKMLSVSDEVIIATDDGTAGVKGFVTDALKQVKNIDHIIAIGPVSMMKAVCETTKIPTTVSLNPIMVDGIGMCGACRVVVDSKTRFACVDGPRFDGHQVDWDNLLLRNTCYDKECSCGR